MRRLLLAGAALWLCAAAPASYDAVCTGSCVASDGTTQPAGTALYRFLWDGQTAFVPQDSAGNALNAVADPGQTTALYKPQVSASLTTALQDQLTTAANGDIVLKHPDGSVSDSGLVVPTPIGSIPPAATVAGNIGTSHAFVPADATQPSLTRSARTMTASDGTFSVMWQTPLNSATPVTPNPAPINTGTQPITCNVTSATASTETGKCWTSQTVGVTLAAITAGLSIGPTQAAAGITVSVFAREPTQ